MPPENSDRQDLEIEQKMGSLLRVGVVLAAVVVAAGGAIYLLQNGSATPSYGKFRPGPADLRTIGGTLRAALSFDGLGIVQCGLLLLVATPVARVLFACIAFARQQDWRYVSVTLVVLGVLFYGLVHGYLEQ